MRKSRSGVHVARATSTRRYAPLGFLPLQGLPSGSRALTGTTVVAHLTKMKAHPRSLRCSGASSFAARSPCPIAGAAGSSRSAALRRLPRRSSFRRARCDLPSTSISHSDAQMGDPCSTWGPSEILRSRVAFVLPHLGPIHLSVDRSRVAFALQRPAIVRHFPKEVPGSVADTPAPLVAVRPWSPTLSSKSVTRKQRPPSERPPTTADAVAGRTDAMGTIPVGSWSNSGP